MSIYKKKIIYIADPLFNKNNFYNYKKIKKKYKLIFNISNKTIETNKLKNFLSKNKNVIGIIAGLEKYNRESLKDSKNLKAISRVGVGIDSLDLNYLNEKKIKVIKLSNELTYCVAELFITLILISLRKIIPNYESLKKNMWNPIIGNNLSNKKIGIIGYGKIGKNLHKLLKIFNCKIYIFEKKKINNIKIKKLSLKKIFKTCDIICLSLNLNDGTKNIINTKILNSANKEIIIINASRGLIINENHLYNFLKKNKKANAFLDCFVKEPYQGKLLKLKNVYPVPHIASFTKETRREMEISASKNLINSLEKIEQKK